MSETAKVQSKSPSLRQKNIHIFLISFVILYLELALIRWVGSEVRIFSYLSNFVLITCFLGIGIGCFQSHIPFKIIHCLPLLLILVFLIAEPKGIRLFISVRNVTEWLSILSDSVIWNAAAELSHGSYLFKFVLATAGCILTFLILVLIMYIFVPLGRHLGTLFDQYPDPITGYSVNVLGSLFGAWFFTGLSFVGTTPFIWFAVFLLLTGFYFPKKRTERLWWIASVAGILLSLYPFSSEFIETRWSPYQKLGLKPLSWINEYGHVTRGTVLQVNNTAFQFMSGSNEDPLGYYNVPYLVAGKVNRMLVVGAGTGNDTAAALQNNIGHIDAVDIDPVILDLGKQYHPAKPYQDPRVRLVIDDARAFFENTKLKYDLIWFGFLDAHTLSSSYNNLRLDHYVYTKESFEKVKSLLNESGIVVILFAADTEWIATRLFGLLKETFDNEPLVYHHINNGHYRGTVLMGGNVDFSKKLSLLDEHARIFIEKNRLPYKSNVRLTTDDWPFLYLEKNRVPSLHLILSVILILCFLLFRRTIFRSQIKIKWEFFFLGAGFLLLEVQAITKGALLFGSTWIINSIMISQVLIWILVSNYTAVRFFINQTLVLLCLAVNVIIIYLTPLRIFYELGYVPRLIFGSFFLTLPVFFAGLLFATFFRNTKHRNYALGSNLMGALCGGLLESFSFIFGFKFLLFPTALFYLAAYSVRRITKNK